MRGVPTRRYSLLPPAEGRLPALLPLAGEGGAKRRMRGERSELLLIFLRRPAADQHQELSRRDGAEDRHSDVKGTRGSVRVDHGGRRFNKKKKLTQLKQQG